MVLTNQYEAFCHEYSAAVGQWCTRIQLENTVECYPAHLESRGLLLPTFTFQATCQRSAFFTYPLEVFVNHFLDQKS